MENEELVKEILSSSNLQPLFESASDFIKAYVEKLIVDLTLYVDNELSVGEISFVSIYTMSQELSQEITGVPSAYSAIDGEKEVLAKFAEKYSKLGIEQYDDLAREVILDFLNLHNGLFVVQLSKMNICELSLTVPKKNGLRHIKSPVTGKITVIPITFSFGTINFLLCELPV